MSVEVETQGEFQAFGMIYGTEREAIIRLIDVLQAEESAAGLALASWARVCKNPSLRGGLSVIAERESFHGRVFAARMQALGMECRAAIGPERGREYRSCLADPAISDEVKLARLHDSVGDAETLIAPIQAFAERITHDLETKEALRLYCDDEISSGRWLCEMCDRLSVPRNRVAFTADAA
jgi:hypothetical protein